jgi:hypothetical protein
MDMLMSFMDRDLSVGILIGSSFIGIPLATGF